MITEALNHMDHQQATQLTAVEKYLLNELPSEVRDEFEEHFFDCEDCATDLRVTAEFMDAARNELRANPVKVSGPVIGVKSRAAFFWPRVGVWSALAASLLVIAYQNVVEFPGSATAIAEMKAPELLPAVSLVSGNSRGGEVPAVAVGPSKPFLLLLDIPTQDRFTSYTCLLFSPEGSLIWKIGVSAQQAKDTVLIRVPSNGKQSGKFTLTVQGNGQGGQPGPVDISHLSFTLTSLH